MGAFKRFPMVSPVSINRGASLMSGQRSSKFSGAEKRAKRPLANAGTFGASLARSVVPWQPDNAHVHMWDGT